MANINYDKIISRSFHVTKKYKWLWVYGLVLSVFAGSSFGNFRFNLPFDSLEKLQKEAPADLKYKTADVLGAAANEIYNWFENIPVSTWIILGIFVFLILLLWIIMAWLLRFWAKGGLIYGLEKAEKNEPVNLSVTAPYGISRIKPLFVYAVLSALIIFGLVLSLVVIFLLGLFVFSFIPLLRIIWMIGAGLLFILTLFLGFIFFTLAGVYAERLIILKDYKPFQAWKKGLLLVRRNFLPSCIMGFLNSALGCGAGCLSTLLLIIILGVPAIIFIVLLFTQNLGVSVFIPIIGLILIFCTSIHANYLFSAWVTVFKHANWNQFFKEIMKEEKKK